MKNFLKKITIVEVVLGAAIVGCAVMAFRTFGGPVAEAVTDAAADAVQ